MLHNQHHIEDDGDAPGRKGGDKPQSKKTLGGGNTCMHAQAYGIHHEPIFVFHCLLTGLCGVTEKEDGGVNAMRKCSMPMDSS